MKNLFLSVFAFSVCVGLAVAAVCPDSGFPTCNCFENDGGLVITQQGTASGTLTTGVSENHIDSCSSGTLTEWYCSDNTLMQATRICGNFTATPYCASGKCVQCTAASHCNDSKECTVDTCDSGSCVHTNKATGTSCTGGFCYSGDCVSCTQDSHCDDGNPCTYNFCTFDKTCYTNPNPMEGENCGVDQVCSGGVCVDNTSPPSCSSVYVYRSVQSGQSATTTVHTSNADMIEWTCTNFTLSGSVATYTAGSSVTNSATIAVGADVSSNLQYVNDSSSDQIRFCDFAVWHHSRPLAKSHCYADVLVHDASVSAPTLTISANPVNIGWMDSTTLTWTVGNDAGSCIATGDWPTTGAKAFSNGTHTEQVDWGLDMGAKTLSLECFSGAGGTGLSSGKKTVTVIVEDEALPRCTGYNHTVSSGDAITALVATSSLVNRISWDCTDFTPVIDNTVTYSSGLLVHNALDVIPDGSSVSMNLTYINNSGSTQSRDCTYSVWNTGNPSKVGTCTGVVTVEVPGSYFCHSTRPAYASAWDSEESSDLPNNLTNWTYSATDTSTKCQYKCNTGYTYSGGLCVSNCTDTCASLGYTCGTQTICGVATSCGGVCPSSVDEDCGLRIFDGAAIVKAACQPVGSTTSPLRIGKNGVVRGIILVATTDPNATKVRIRTATGVKAIKKLSTCAALTCGGSKTTCDCVAAGGTVVTTGGCTSCSIPGSACPSGMTQYSNWTYYASDTCGSTAQYCKTGDCGTRCVTPTRCTTLSSRWLDTTISPTCSYSYAHEYIDAFPSCTYCGDMGGDFCQHSPEYDASCTNQQSAGCAVSAIRSYKLNLQSRTCSSTKSNVACIGS